MADKYRYWWFIAYPESLPENWETFIEETTLPTYTSPLHENDLNPDGTHKKPHYHIIVCFDGPTTYNNVYKNICQPLKATIPKPVLSLHGAYDYLTHKHNEDKYRYDESEIGYYNGATEAEVDKESYTDALHYHIINIIATEQIKSFKALVFRILKENNRDMDSILRNHTYYYKELL